MSKYVGKQGQKYIFYEKEGNKILMYRAVHKPVEKTFRCKAPDGMKEHSDDESTGKPWTL